MSLFNLGYADQLKTSVETGLYYGMVSYCVVLTLILSLVGVRVVRKRGKTRSDPNASTSHPPGVERQIQADQQECSQRSFIYQ
jgi:hypothetical protein